MRPFKDKNTAIKQAISQSKGHYPDTTYVLFDGEYYHVCFWADIDGYYGKQMYEHYEPVFCSDELMQ